MEQIALSIEQMQELDELGIDISNASMAYYEKLDGWILSNDATLLSGYFSRLPAYTLQDILERLPNWIDPYYTKIKYQKYLFYHVYTNKWICAYSAPNGCCIKQFGEDSPIEAAFKMLKWCKEYKCL